MQHADTNLSGVFGLRFHSSCTGSVLKRDRDLPELLIDQVRQARQYVKAGIRRKGDHHRLGGPPGGQLRLVNLTVLRKDGSETTPGVDAVSWFKASVEEAVAHWTLVNETPIDVALPLAVEFRLSGYTASEPIETNQVIFREDKLLIRVLGKIWSLRMPEKPQ